MSSKLKIQKCSNNLRARLDEDRLSDLPTCLIVKIISLLSTKDAVMTSALSTKWKYFWTFITNLDFDDNLTDPQPSQTSFKRIINSVLLSHDKLCLQRFCLKSNHYYDGSLVNAWISSILPCNLQELELSVPIIKHPVLFPSYIFLCKTLVVLKIDAEGKANIPTSIALPNLKILNLDKVEISDDVALNCLLDACTVLEELKLRRCIGKDVRVINITSHTLTNLTLVLLAYDGEKPPTNPMKYQIVLDTPSLQNISVIDYVAEDYMIKKINHLTEADISIGLSISSDKRKMHTKAVTNLFNALSEVRTLGLSSRSIEAIRWYASKLPEFRNLIKLEISTDKYFASDVLADVLATLLEHSPCLETLDLRKVGYHGSHFFGLSHNDIVPSCFRSHLKLIKLDGFAGVQKEREMVKFILKKAQVLEKLVLRYPTYLYDTWVENVFLKEIVEIPRASSICRIEVV